METNSAAGQFHKPKTIPAKFLQKNNSVAPVSTPVGLHHQHIGGDHWTKKLALSFSIPADYEAVTRRDYFENHYVIIAPKRHLRPTDAQGMQSKIIETAASPRLDLQPEIDSIVDRSGNWKTKVVENKYPALTLNNPAAFGKQEIVIDTPLPNTPLGAVNLAQLEAVLLTYQLRTKKLLAVSGIKYVTVFKNEGPQAGASLAHAHSQIFATPFIPENIINTSQAAESYFQKKSVNPYDAIIEFETKQKQRLISQNEHFISFCPYAPRWPLECWIVPKRQITSVVELEIDYIKSLATLLAPILARLSKYEIDFNFYLENGASPNHRFSLKIQPRSITSWGGFEVATNVILNPLPPEIAANWYKNKSA